MKRITSKSNETIKETKKLLHKKYRKSSYLIEGWHLYQEAKNAGVKLLKIFILEEYYEKFETTDPIYVVPMEILKELTDSKTPQGIVVEIAFETNELIALSKGRYLVLEDIQDPGNLGTMVRTADAAGYSGILISDKSADIYNQKTLRSMQGSHFHLPILRLEIHEIVERLQALKIPILGTTLSKDSIDYKQLEYLSDFALVMGNEGQGISEYIQEKADYLVHINMPGQSESLNVAVAAGVLMFSFI